MNKKVVYSAIFISLFCIAGFALGVTISNPLSSSTFSALLTKIATGVGEIITYLGAIMIIVAGILYLLSAGNPQKIQTAKTALIYAIIGIAIGLAAQAIVDVIKNIIGAS